MAMLGFHTVIPPRMAEEQKFLNDLIYGGLQDARQKTGPPWEVLERDYLLSWILGGIKRPPLLGKLL